MIDTVGGPERGLIWRENLRTVRLAAWLGWQIESNWTDPLAFFILAILRPLATALTIVIMYQVVAGGGRPELFAYLFISNACFVLVVGTMSGMAWAIFDDRENYKMLKYIYTAPTRKFAYLVGRATAKVLIGLLTATILLIAGGVFLGVPLRLDHIAWGGLLVTTVLGMGILAGLGIVLAGVALVIARNGEMIGEVTAGMLLLFSSAYFPPDILPGGLQQVALALPVTYWLEAMRRSLAGGILAGPSGPVSPLLAQAGDSTLFAILVVSALVSLVGSFFFYQWVEHQAKERGMIDRTTEH